MSDVLVIIPTYNEKENIEAIIRAVFQQQKAFHVLVVDDNSPDGTAQIVTHLQKEFDSQKYILCRRRLSFFNQRGCNVCFSLKF